MTKIVIKKPSEAILWFCLAVAILFFAYRGPYRGFTQRGTDLAAPYIAGWRFYHGANPYPQDGLISLWHARGAPSGAQLNESDSRPVYPPSTLPIIGLLSILPWKWAQFLYLAACTLLYALLLLRLSRYLASLRYRLALMIYGFLFAPIIAGVATANLSIVTFILAVYSIVFVEARSIGSGILLALSFCLKPTIAAPVILLFLVFRYWRSLFVFVAGSGMITVWALLWLRSSAGWYVSYKSNLRYLFGPHGAASFLSNDGGRYDLLNLQVPIYGMTASARVSEVLAFGIAGVLLTLWIWRYGLARKITWSAAASLGLIGLLPIYQRNYSAGFVLLAVLWAIRSINGSLRAQALLGISLLLLVPGEAILRDYSHHLPPILLTPLAENLVFAYTSWVIVVMTVLILWKPVPEDPI